MVETFHARGDAAGNDARAGDPAMLLSRRPRAALARAGATAAIPDRAHTWNRATGRCSMRCAAARSYGATTGGFDVRGNEIVDVLIIGSGASGAAVAWSLAETQMRILCLEQGDWMKQADFPSQRAGLGGAAIQPISTSARTGGGGRPTIRSTTTTRR